MDQASGIYRKTTKRDDWRDVPLTEQMVEVFDASCSTAGGSCSTQLGGGGSIGGYVFSDDPVGARWLRPDFDESALARRPGYEPR